MTTKQAKTLKGCFNMGRPKKGTTAEQRFWQKVNKNGPTMPHMTTNCWEWVGANNKHKYGSFFYDNKIQRAHRVSYQLYYGNIPDGIFICHHCDNKKCVRPDHLFAGTRQDNTDDMMKKGRHIAQHGMKHNKAKLTDSDIIEIRNLHKQGSDCRDIAKQKGVAFSTIYRIVGHKLWRHI